MEIAGTEGFRPEYRISSTWARARAYWVTFVSDIMLELGPTLWCLSTFLLTRPQSACLRGYDLWMIDDESADHDSFQLV